MKTWALLCSVLCATVSGSNIAATTAQQTAANPVTLAADEIRVTLLGTGSPVVSAERFGPATLVEAGGKMFLFDAGRGALVRLGQLGDPRALIPQLQHIFFTHQHSDHLVGLSDIYLTGWLYERNVPLHVYGPPGVKAMLGHLEQAFAGDIAYRKPLKQDQSNPTAGLQVIAAEFQAEQQTIYEQDGVRISAFAVDHGPIKPSFGYKIEYAGKKVIISGDTTYSEVLAKEAMQADLIVHEVAQASPGALKTFPHMQKILSVHTTPQQAAELFNKTKPKLAVYTHLLLFGVTPEQVVAQTKATYSGDVQAGHDLMQLVIGKTIQVSSAAAAQIKQP